jgi:GDP-D-mannose 3',5'-epimerase
MDLVTGAGGFIGGHLVRRLLDEGREVRAVDIKPRSQWYQLHDSAQNFEGNLAMRLVCESVVDENIDQVYNLAADMGGMGFIENNKLQCMLSVLTSTHMLTASVDHAERFFYSSSACVYAADKQVNPEVTALKESDAYPAEAEDGYGWEKLFTERMCRHFREDTGLITRVARYHNVYGPNGTFEGGREKAPAAICRKVIEAKLTNGTHIDIWGDGLQTRSFMYIDDCVEGTLRIMRSDVEEPLNLGSDELVSVNQLVDMVQEIAGVSLKRVHDLSAPQGVRGRNSDNTLIREKLDWAPSISLYDGLEKTYAWIYDQMKDRY